MNNIDPTGLKSSNWTRVMGGLRFFAGLIEFGTGQALALSSFTAAFVTSETVIGAIAFGALGAGGIALGAHGLDQMQAGYFEAVTGEYVDSFTSERLQSMGMSPLAANLTDAGISIVGTFGAGYINARIRIWQIRTTEPILSAGLNDRELLNAWEKGSRAFNGGDFGALGGNKTTALQKLWLMKLGVTFKGEPFIRTTTGPGRIAYGALLTLTGMTPKAGLALGPVGSGLGTVRLIDQSLNETSSNKKSSQLWIDLLGL